VEVEEEGEKILHPFCNLHQHLCLFPEKKIFVLVSLSEVTSKSQVTEKHEAIPKQINEVFVH